MNNKSDYNYKRLFRRLFIITTLIIWLGYNYHWLQEYMSSNLGFITQYQGDDENMQKNRNPAVAGFFYPSSGSPLNKMVDGYLSQKLPESTIQPKILIVPHAGYKYSASIAASAYRELLPYRDKIKNVIIVGPAHRIWVEGAALSASDTFSTPLGKISINKDINEIISQNADIIYANDAHKDEHSIEVQLPFLQKSLKDFKIIPIVYGGISPQNLAKALSPYMGDDKTIIIFSADMSHYLDYENAKKQDAQTAEMIKSGLTDIKNHMSCGSTGLNTALILAKENNLVPKLLDSGNSGDTSGDKNSVVGYASWIFTEEDSAPQKKLSKIEQEVENLNKFVKEYGSALVAVAKKSLQEAVKKNKYIPEKGEFPDALFDKGASFVTIKKDNILRGCIGSLVPHNAIIRDVATNTYKASNEDTRFSPIKEEELSSLSISISILTDFEPITFSKEEELLAEIEEGIDGIIIRDGNRQGVFLPSVWEDLPIKKDFLNNLKIKAGLSPNYWSENLKAYRFRVVEIK